MRLSPALQWPVYFVMLFAAATARCAESELLTNAADVIALPAERASLQLKVRVTGIVTAADPTLRGSFFVQDSTGGIFVENGNGRRLEPGDLVEVAGLSMVGAYAPIIMAPTIIKLGAAPLPPARRVPIERLMSGAEDSQRIEVEGVVRAARLDGPHQAIDVVSGGYRFRVYAPPSTGAEPQSLVGAQVRVRGTAAEAHNRSLRQLISAEIFVPVPADFILEKPEAANPFDSPVLPLSSLAQYHRNNSLNDRVHVLGVVTLQRPGESVFLQDAGGALQVQSRAPDLFKPGETIEAAGFPNFEGYLPVLQDAVFRKTAASPVALMPKPATLDDVQKGLHHADYVSFEGRLIDRTIKPLRRQVSDPPAKRVTLVLQNSTFLFTAEEDDPAREPVLASIPLGSTLSVRGICLTEIDSEGKLKSFRVLLRAPGDVAILASPSWFTPRRLFIGLAAVCAVLVVIGSWTVMLSKKNATLNFLIREREKAQIELQHAHDQLEERVKERTNQLKFEITARKEADVQSKAVLAERTRLAQELHDTLEQSLTGIGLQMDAAARLFERNPDNARHHLQLARNLMGQSQVEVRRSVWDLRCRALEQFDLSGALLSSARQMTHDTGIDVEVLTRGPVRPLPEIVEENLLRMGQEALTNVIKHSRASRAKIELVFAARQVVLQIEDDGQGFVPNGAGPNGREGHFGLLGMSERAKRLGGKIILTSAPGKGAVVRAEIPLASAPPSPVAEPAKAQS